MMAETNYFDADKSDKNVPAVNSPWPQVRQALNYSSHLECVIDAFPTASVVWFKDDEPLNDTSRYQQPMQTRGTAATTFASTLVVLRTDYSDYGNYTCRAVNALGISAFTLQLGHSPLPILPMTRSTNLAPEPDRTNTRTPSFSGFVLGMLPPLCISVYIILHLSFFRSRYAEERTEEEGGDGLDEIVWEQGFKS
uniref:Ig-like domain-containing protein n=1 Tax=Strigamia maritima TaxID=126957 RepID=T1JMT9_STRMM